ncbi:MAG: hypothetical protein OSB57_14755, partial [Planctomycetota bacterium]|nr:hypothetical protein [Planctomycetota bacterium]
MKWTTATLALLSVGTLLLTGKVLLRPNRATPSEILDGVQVARERGITDAALLLRDIDRAVHASAADLPGPADPDLSARLLKCRAELHAHLGDYAAAIENLDTALDLNTDTEAELSHLKVKFQAEGGDQSGALLAAIALRERFPEFLAAHALAGTLASQEAAAALKLAVDKTDGTLLRKDSEVAQVLLTAIAARAEGADPERARQASQLRRLFMPKFRTELQQVLGFLDDASQLNAQARRSLARAAGAKDNEAGRVLLLELYMAAGQYELAAELGSILLLQPPARHSESVFRLTFQSLLRLDQNARALSLVRDLDWEKMRPGSELCMEIARLLFERKAWAQLSPVTARLTKLQERATVSAARFFDGFAYSAQKKWSQAAKALITFIQTDKGADIIPFARPRANLQLAHIYRELVESAESTDSKVAPGEVAKWRQLEFAYFGSALGSTVLASHPGWLEEVDAEEFIRFKNAGLELPQDKETGLGNVGYRKPEEYVAHAMSLSPRRTQEWMPEWERIGFESLSRSGHTIRDLFASIRAQGRSIPNVDIGP